MMFNHGPEFGQHALPAITLRRAHHHVRTFRERKQAGDQHTVDVEQRQPTEHILLRTDSVAEHLRRAPRVGHFITMAAHGDLRKAGGAAGAEVRRVVIRIEAALAEQTIARLASHASAEIVELQMRRPRRGLSAARTHGFAQLLQAGRPALEPHHPLGQVYQHHMTQAFRPPELRR